MQKKKEKEITVLKGSFDMWRIFFKGEATKEELEIDYENTETVISTWAKGELFLRKKRVKGLTPKEYKTHFTFHI